MAAAKWALGIVPAGIALGVLLGAAVDPDMKDAPAPEWRLTAAELITASNEAASEAWPEDLAAARGHRPDFDYDIEVWALPVPAQEVAALAEGQVASSAAEPAADGAEALAAPEPESVTPPETVPETTPEVRRPELSGLY